MQLLGLLLTVTRLRLELSLKLRPLRLHALNLVFELSDRDLVARAFLSQLGDSLVQC